MLPYNQFIDELRKTNNLEVHTGIFGADMNVTFTNDGPVTIIIDSKDK
ncbi:MAG: D-tyrosyl-tRNA(Tyr) deacylase [Haloplasmataceae bacterium]|jgi:D-tyrosyl-tRNA(Tyr) deacylase|nr:D-tyrosyl-tRNA(Tyr) deacylase [Haloplasmataceae bacterium]